ncbi:caspase family protein [Neorhodopirellula pilleata]|uniref:WD domain, G-beta repeat n=1 Tax=Neorhodopirellula pilleata TaxID=2714738 RepID=A0A5C6AVY1_9BACT|nr:caspase family protein [Neorhodopirellula pilleata]TWU03299.1 WD domain, G-beta repeat [Neorhodopirellula pilleata]
MIINRALYKSMPSGLTRVLVWAFASATAIATAQLPDETRLPNANERRAAQEAIQSTQDLPGETSLRGTKRVVQDSSDAGNLLPMMPTELVLQRGDMKDAPVADATPKADQDPTDADDDTPGDQRPILRLNYDGHSSRVNVVRFNETGDRLITAGQDKDVHVWQRDLRNPQQWVHTRTVRWQVWRGPRGVINDLAIRQNEIAMAGYGAMGGTGEVWVADAATGKWIRSLADYTAAHRVTVDSLSWSKDATPILVSADLAGRVVRWTTDPSSGRWRPETIIGEDTSTYGDSTAKLLKPFRRFHAMTTFGGQIATTHLNRLHRNPIPGGGEFTFPIWQVQLHAPESGSQPVRLDGEIPGLITQLRSSSDQRVLAVACHTAREVKLWRRQPETNTLAVENVSVDGRPLFVDIDASGGRLLVGTEADDSPAIVALYDLTTQPTRLIDSMVLKETAASGVFDPTNRSVVLAIGNALQIHDTDAEGRWNTSARQVLKTPIKPITRIAASAQADPVRVAISRAKTDDGDKPFSEVFNLSDLSLESVPVDDIADDQFLEGQRLDTKITVRPSATDFNVFQLYRDETLLGTLPLRPELHGRPTTVSTVEIQGQPLAIVGTEGQNNVYVFSLAADPSAIANVPLKIVRQFRGHFGTVRSTSASADGRFLLTGSDDATLCAWNLGEVMTTSDMVNRWGATFETLDGKLTVASIDEAGPLFFRGVRIGDQVSRLKWPDEQGKTVTAETPETIGKALAETTFDTQVVFEVDRQGRPIETFQMFPAWYPLATVLIDEEREWAMWTPTGIYNASLAGNQRFGWQLNRGLGADVEYFRADQFRASLERPAVMRRLLSSGSLAAAMRVTLGGGPPPGETAIINQIASRPRIRILSPIPEMLGKTPTVGPGPSTEVIARIESPAGVGIASVKAFMDGIPGVLKSQETIDATTTEFRWDFELPRQTELQLDVYAATNSQSAARETIVVRRLQATPPAKAKMHLIAMGISRYADPNILPLDFAAKATDAVADALRQYAEPLYDVTTTQLVDSQATRSLWRIYARSTLDQLKEAVGPDDLVVMYLCGHGMRDRRTGQWYFVSADADYRDLMNDQYNDCVSLSDLSVFASLPCRKLAILDSCHSGAVQSFMREDDLKSAIRVLQDDVVMTITASEGREEAAEVVEAGLGRFTSRLLEALAGKADLDRDGEVSLRETVQYVSRTVAEDSSQEGMMQHPTAGPPDLINRLNLPLTRP